jgi:phospholipid/cholesterol/gamma-HCH transport system permease protein
MQRPNNFFNQAGHQIIRFVDYMGLLSLFFFEAFTGIFRRPWFFQEVIAQMFHLGVKSLPLVGVAAFSVGLVLAMQTIGVLSMFGASNYIATIVGLSMVRELGPVLTALMVVGRAGSGMGAELGSMLVTSQIDAMRVSAVNPMKFLVSTRLLACMLVLPLLTGVADVLGILGGWVIGVTQIGLSSHYYYQLTLQYIGLKDIIPGILKTVVFGAIIGTVGCFEGYKTQHGTFGVGQSTQAAVVSGSLLVLIADVFLTRISLIIWP